MMEVSSKRPSGPVLPPEEAQHALPREIDLGMHHLLLKSDQSIELACSKQGNPESEYVLCLDAVETYRLMQCLYEWLR